MKGIQDLDSVSIKSLQKGSVLVDSMLSLSNKNNNIIISEQLMSKIKNAIVSNTNDSNIPPVSEDSIQMSFGIIFLIY